MRSPRRAAGSSSGQPSRRGDVPGEAAGASADPDDRRVARASPTMQRSSASSHAASLAAVSICSAIVVGVAVRGARRDERERCPGRCRRRVAVVAGLGDTEQVRRARRGERDPLAARRRADRHVVVRVARAAAVPNDDPRALEGIRGR